MRYLVITSKHHDGFGLFDSAATDWDVMGTPFQRDILAELSAACARGGVRFCTYHSIMDWHHPDYLPRRPWEFAERPETGADFERFVQYLHAQVTEVITKYHPGVMWFDGEWESTWNHERGVALYELCRALDPDLIVNNRVDVHRGGMAGFSQASEAVGDFGTPEQEIPASGIPGVDWETCMTMNDHWGWNKSDPDWKSVEMLVRNLIDVASKGGNYLLNVGPRADGTFPPQAVERLKGIGQWMRGNGEAIHGTSASPFDALPWGRVTMKRKGAHSVLYLHVFERPGDGRLVLPGFGSEPLAASWLAGPRLALPFRRQGTDVVIELPETLPDPIASVVALEIEGEPIVYRAPEIVAESDIFVRPLEVRLATKTPGVEIRYTLDGNEPSTSSTRYERPIWLSDTTTVTAAVFHDDQKVAPTACRSFRHVVLTPPPPAMSNWTHTQPGVSVLRYTGDWDRLPDFSALQPLEERVVPEIELDDAMRAEYTGLRFLALLDVPRGDVYRFSLTSDDGSELWINGQRVVDNDGLHGSEEKTAYVPLQEGRQDTTIEVRWFNKTGGAELSLQWAPLGEPLAPVRGLTTGRR
jgi:alpha-L-fucosidase